MPSKVLFAGAILILMNATALPASAQTPEPEGTEITAPETAPRSPARDETPAPEVTASDSGEGPSHRLTGAAVIFNLLDGNGDGAIDLDEASAVFEAIFTTLDADDDGKLSKNEINTALRRMHGGHGDRGYDHRDEEDDPYEGDDDR